MRRVFLSVSVALMLTGCGLFDGSSSKRILFDGQYFRGSAKAVDRDDRRYFESTAKPVSRSLEGARAAVAYHATRYCIRWFGISDVAWDTDPQAEVVPVENDTLTLRGTCLE